MLSVPVRCSQIIWRMVSHTLRFAAFIVVVVSSFSLAFYALFFTCSKDSLLGGRFGTFGASVLTVFEAGLGQFDFTDFDDVEVQCPDHAAPGRVHHAAIFLLVMYLIIMAVVLLNLLIAVLSTAHSEVHENGEKEYHLARTRLIAQSARAVARRRIPPPFNLIPPIMGVVFDGIGEAYWRVTQIPAVLR